MANSHICLLLMLTLGLACSVLCLLIGSGNFVFGGILDALPHRTGTGGPPLHTRVAKRRASSVKSRAYIANRGTKDRRCSHSQSSSLYPSIVAAGKLRPVWHLQCSSHEEVYLPIAVSICHYAFRWLQQTCSTS